jgi:glycosyltransferase involved in cell wall biosynthesis
MTMRFNVITCTWNSADYLRASMDSVLAQDWPDIEYIFVDGGSTDGTLEMIRAIPRQVKLIENVRGGISRAMNAGIEAATGDVITHLHSDDYYAHPQVLSHVARALDETGAEWLFGRCLSDIEGERVPEGYAVPPYSYRRLLKGNFIPHPATFVRKSLLDRAGSFDEGIKYAMDYDLWLRLGRLSEPVQLDEHLAVFRRHGGSLSTANRMASFEDDFAVRMKYAGKTPWSLAYHWAHYLVRRRRACAAPDGNRGEA